MVNKNTPFYSELFDELGSDFILEAGYIDDNSDGYIDDKHAYIPCTHVPNINDSPNPVVLLTTGGFSPFHEGHIQMMKNAKSALEKIGHTVVAGYVSPSHDKYVLSKAKDNYNIYKRMTIIEKMINDHEWLHVDGWEAIFNIGATNFTFVIDRLDKYLYKWLGIHIPIYYVCGGDNARFALSFVNEGRCIVVNRPPYNIIKYKSHKLLKDNNRVLWVNGDSCESSTRIRNIGSIDFVKKNSYIRKENINKYENDIISLITPSFKNVAIEDVEEQRKQFKNYVTEFKRRNISIVNLDALMNGDYNMRVSRKFDLFGIRKIGYVNSSINSIKSNQNVVLFDDDIHTGGTINFAKKCLEMQGVGVQCVISFKVAGDEEVIDCRDFFIVGENAGLMVQMPNSALIRLPYIYPFVCPWQRSSIIRPIDFSIEIWKLNLQNLLNLGLDYKVDDVNISSILKFMGFDAEYHMTEVCEYFIEFLNKFKDNENIENF